MRVFLFETLHLIGYISAILAEHICDRYLNLNRIEDENYDISTVNDLVTNQYEKLPYPRVTEKYLKNEEEFYKTNKEPIQISPVVRLEKLNHYLYQGGESFR